MKKISLLFSLSAIFFTNTLFSQTILNESFDGVTFVPTGWYKAKISPVTSPALGQWERVTTGASPVVNPHSGSAMARFDSPTAGYNTISELGTSVLNLSFGSTYRVRFWVYRGDNAFLQNDLLDVYVNTQQNITGASKLGSIFISRMKSPTETANGWYEYTFDLPTSFSTATNYIIFRATGGSYNVIYLDDVVVEASTCQKPINPTASNILTNSATLNWIVPAIGSPSGYDWEIRTNGSAGTGALGMVASGSTAAGITTTTVAGLTQGIPHSFYVRSSCGADKSTWTNPIIFNTQCDPAPIPYTEKFDGITSGLPACTITENINGGSTWTSSAQLYGSSYSRSAPNAMCSFSGGAGASNPENDWFYTAALSLEAGKCYQLFFAYSTLYAYSSSMRVKLGTGQNETVMTTAELFNSSAITNNQYATYATSFSVATTGVYFIGFNHYGTLGGFNGALFVDDISITESVGFPTAINANPVGGTTAQLNWSVPACGSATSYEWELRTSGAAGSGASGLTSTGIETGLNTTFTSLIENKFYTFYIRSKNNALTSQWSAGVPFQTSCDVRSLPYIQNFDGVIAPALPTCFIKQDISVPYNAWNTWQNVANERSNSLPNCMRFGTNNSTTVGNNWVFTPPFNFIAGKSYRLQFYYRNDIYSMSEKLEVKYGMGANASSMTSPAIFINTDIRNSIFKKVVVDFVPTVTRIYTIGFHGISDALRNFVCIDDIKVEETPTCDVVKEITSTIVTSSSATINWLSPQIGVPSGYNWELRTAGNAGSGTTGLVSSGALGAGAVLLPLSSLASGTAYSFYIRSNCGVENSEWIPYLFTTACAAINVPYNENFDAVAYPNIPPCTRVEEKLDHYKWSTLNYSSRTSPNCLYHSYTFTSPFDDWFFSAPLQLTVGRTYKLSFYYKEEGSGYTDAIEIKMGKYAQGDSMTLAPIYTNTNVSNTAYQLATITFTVPASGVYYVGLHSVIASYSRGVMIDDLNVNEMTPDLIISNQSLSTSTAATSETITANFTVANQGLASAAPQKTYFYLSADNILTPGANGDTLIGVYVHATAIDGVTNTGSLAKQLSIPCALSSGSYYLFMVADGESVVNEISEANNAISLPITIMQGEYWNGLVNTSWETAGNWSCNQIPDATTNVVINSGTVVVHISTTIRSLTVKAGVNFSVAPGVVLTILH
jgi:hypothetical protein